MIAVLDHRIPSEAVSGLSRADVEPIFLPAHPALPAPVASHPDLLVFFTETACYTVESYWTLAKMQLQQIERLANLELRICKGNLGDRYPADVLLDAAPVGKRLFCAPANTAEEIVSLYRDNVVPVRQGYAKCSCVPIGENAIITSDPSLICGAASVGVECLAIEEGHVRLTGYSTGFIGGAASFCLRPSYDTVYFCGDLSCHPNGEEIRAFCNSHKKNAVSLGHFPLTDVGTMFIL